jgi:hypothetical protein
MAQSGVDDEQLARIAELIDYRHLTATPQHFYDGAGLTPEELHDRWAAFVSALSP